MAQIRGAGIGEPQRREDVQPLVEPRRIRREAPEKPPAKAPAKPRRQKEPVPA